MTREVEIEQAIGRLDPEGFARLAVAVLERDGYPTFRVNTVSGKLRSRKGVPDALCEHADGTYSFVQCTVQEKDLSKKLQSDLMDCFERKPESIARSAIREVVVAYSGRIPPDLFGTLKAKAKALRTKVVYCDLDRIKRVVLEKGDDIADDHLGVKVSTQVLPREAFVTRAARQGAVTNYRTAFRFRDDVVERAIQALHEQAVVLIAGNAGVGKTRTALEVMDRLRAADPDLQLLFVRNQGVSFAEELEKRCSAPGRYVVLLDDAQRMGDLQRAMELIVHERSDRHVRFLCTVRSIALEQVSETLGWVGLGAILKLEPWTDDELRTFLHEEFKIQRNLYVDRILDMARGNPRHAAMVASIILKVGDYKGFTHVAQAFRLYYKEHLDRIGAFANADSLRVLFSFAFFHHIEGTAYEMPILPRLLPLLGMEQETFWRHARELDRLELIDLLSDGGPGLIADETFGAFLVHHVLFDKRHMDLGKLLITFFDGYREKVVAALNAVMVIFHADAEQEVLRKAVDEAFAQFQKEEQRDVIAELHEAFHALDPERTLSYVQEQIAAIPKEKKVSSLEFAGDGGHFLDAPLRLLQQMGNGHSLEVRSITLELFLQFLGKCPGKGAQGAKALCSAFQIDDGAVARGLVDQQQVVDQLIAWSRQGNLAATGLFLALAKTYLAKQSWHIRPTRRRNQVQSRVSSPPLNEQFKALRSTVWGYLFELYRSGYQGERIFEVFRAYQQGLVSHPNKALDKFDAGLFFPFAKDTLDPSKVEHCLLVHDLLAHWQQQRTKAGRALAAQFTNPAFELLRQFSFHRAVRERRKARDPFQTWRRRLMALGEGASPVELCRMCARTERLLRTGIAPGDALGPSRAISLVMRGACSAEPEHLRKEIEHQLAKGDPLQLDPSEVLPDLYLAMGAEGLESWIGSLPLRDPWPWWHAFYGICIEKGHPVPDQQALVERCLKAMEQGSYLHLPMLRKAATDLPNLLVQVVRKIVQGTTQGRRGHDPLYPVFTGRLGSMDEIINWFGKEPELLQRAFFDFVCGRGHDDQAAAIFMALTDADPSFPERWVGWRYAERFVAPEPEDFSLTAVWSMRRASHLVDTMYHAARRVTIATWGRDDYLACLFEPAAGEELAPSMVRKQDAWLKARLKRDHGNDRACDLLMGIVNRLPMERRVALTVHFMDQGPTGELLKRAVFELSMGRVALSSNSRNQSQIEFLEMLLQECSGVTRLPHRKLVNEALNKAKEERECQRIAQLLDSRI